MPHDPELTAELQQLIVAGIRAGADARDAAEAWQVPAAVFEDWRARGEQQDAVEPYRTFAREVRTARAQARTKAAIEVFQSAPKVWLEHGPGKNPGEEAINALLQRGFIDACNVLLEALMPFPEARACGSRALDEASTRISRGNSHVKATPTTSLVASSVQSGSGSAVA